MIRDITSPRKQRRPTTPSRGWTESEDVLEKAWESALIRKVVLQIFRLEGDDLDVRADILKIVAMRAGLQRSRLGAWSSPKGTNFITSHGIRLLARCLRSRGKAAEAERFETDVLSHPVHGRG